MNINFDTELTDVEGKLLSEPVAGPGGQPEMEEGPDGFLRPKLEVVTLRRVAVIALQRAWPNEKVLEEVALERLMLAVRVAKGGVHDLTLKERAVIQAATDNWRQTAPLFFFRARQLLDISAE